MPDEYRQTVGHNANEKKKYNHKERVNRNRTGNSERDGILYFSFYSPSSEALILFKKVRLSSQF